MKRGIKRAALLVAAGFVIWTSLAGAGDEASDWQQAQQKNDVISYDLYLAEHPSGQHAPEALSRAVKQAAAGLSSAARSCNDQFPVMIYYVYAAGSTPAPGEEELVSALAAGKKCSFATTLKFTVKVRAVDGMFRTHERMSGQSQRAPLNRGILDLHLIFYPVATELLIDLSDEVIKCEIGRDPWRDPSKQEVYQCSLPHRQKQAEVAEAMAVQMKFDFGHVGSLPDRACRADFWEQLRRQAKNPVVQEVGAIYRLSAEAEGAKAAESDPKILSTIDQVAVLLGGVGKPTGRGY